MQTENKKILVNTTIMYGRLIVTTILGLLVSRYVLLALGAGDFGLYSVVGGLIGMLNVLSTAMSTTTRRFINVEMGKPDGNLNRIFNISRLLHVCFAIFIFFLAETVGLFYIYNYLNVAPEKMPDAFFVFQISTIASVIGIMNIPYQAMLEAKEKFSQIAIFDIVNSVLRFVFVLCLAVFKENILRIYSVGISLLTLVSLSFYTIANYIQWKEIVKYKLYFDIKQYKKILFFNNYVALGAAAYLSRTQASSILVNFFFGTVTNAAFAIGYAVENYCMMFVANIGSAAASQITRNYTTNLQRSFFLTAMLNRLSIYLMLLVIVPFSIEIDFVLKLWLKKVPEGTHIICILTLVSALVRVMFGSKDKIIQASGKIKWFQITGCILDLSCIPISYVLFMFGYPASTVISVYIAITIVHGFWTFLLMKKLLHFDVLSYFKIVYVRVFFAIMGILVFVFVDLEFHFESFFAHVMNSLVIFFVCLLCIYTLGLDTSEKVKIKTILKTIIK